MINYYNVTDFIAGDREFGTYKFKNVGARGTDVIIPYKAKEKTTYC